MTKLDYSLHSPEERNELVKQIIKETPPEKLTNKYLEILSNYILAAEKKNKNILTENRLVTVNRRETSFQGVVEYLGQNNNEDGIYNFIIDDKDILLTPKICITQQDIDTVPGLKELRDAIAALEQKIENTPSGRKKYALKKQLIEMRQDQYILKNSYRQPLRYSNGVKNFTQLSFDEKITMDSAGEPHSNAIISFFNPKHVSALLVNYSKLKEDSYGKFWTDSYYLMRDLDDLIEETLKDHHPYYYQLLIYKIDGKPNLEIQKLLEKEFSIHHTVEYISALWRQKIPYLLSEQAKTDYIVWYYTTQAYGKWKKCSCCGQIKLAHNRFFSKNKTSKDGFYSICKECRNRRKEDGGK